MRGEKQKIKALIHDFSSRMHNKLLKKRRSGWSGWQNEHLKKKLEDDLLLHLKNALQGDATQWVDVANYAAFLDYQSQQAACDHDDQQTDREGQ